MVVGSSGLPLNVFPYDEVLFSLRQVGACLGRFPMERVELLPIPNIRFDGGAVVASIIGSSFYRGEYHIYVAVPSPDARGSGYIVYRCTAFSAYRDVPAPPPPPPDSDDSDDR